MKTNKVLSEFLASCYKGDLNGVENGIERNVDLNATAGNGNSALRVACKADQIKVVTVLLENGADPNMRLWISSRVDGRQLCKNGTAIFYAQSVEMVELLIKHGAELSIIDDNGNGVLEWWKFLESHELLTRDAVKKFGLS